MKMSQSFPSIKETMGDRCICALAIVVVAVAAIWILTTQMFVGAWT
jgi:hypothetical protein